MKQFFCILTLVLISTSSIGQKVNNQDTLETVYFPIPGPGYDSSECGKLIAQKYGFIYRRIPGCGMVGDRRSKTAKKEFRKANQIMKKRHGKDWREKYEKEVAICKSEKN